MDQKHLGARNELLACAWLLHEGYEVFRNVSPHGPIDLVARRDGEILFIDVKTAADDRARYYHFDLPESEFQDICRLYIFPDNKCLLVRPTTAETAQPRPCKWCKKAFKPVSTIQVYCCARCAKKREMHDRYQFVSAAVALPDDEFERRFPRLEDNDDE